MDLLQTTLEAYLSKAANNSLDLNTKLVKEGNKAILTAIQRAIEDDPDRDFTLRLSTVGRPLCQLQMEKAKAPTVPIELTHPVKMIYGAMIEALFIMLLKEASIKVIEEQGHVVLSLEIIINGEVKTVNLKGTFDILLDDGIEEAIYDVKSASGYSFDNKFRDYETLKANDTFGYITQLYAYAKAKGKRAGGWLVINKEDGRFKFIKCPDVQDKEMEEALLKAAHNVQAIESNAPFKRCFTDVEEKFNRKPTGNRVLGSPCKYCPFRYTCWPNLQYLPVQSSKAANPPYAYYTELNTPHQV